MDEPNVEKHTNLECRSTTGCSWPGASLYKSPNLGWQWRRPRRAVVAASEAAQGHEANGLPPGPSEFQTLLKEVACKVQEYSVESGDPLYTLKARLPALCALERLAKPAPTVPRNKAGLTLGVLIAAVLGPIGSGALIGLGTGMAHWIDTCLHEEVRHDRNTGNVRSPGNR
jgi:hypothetical protein